MGGTTFHLSPASTWPDSASCNVCCRGACAKRLFRGSALAAAKEEIDVEKSGDRCGDHKVTRLGSKFAAVYPSRSLKCDVEQRALRYPAAVGSSDDEELAEIERRMPADRPPKRACDANADTEEHTEDKDHSDIDCVFVRFLKMIASKQCCRDQRGRPKTSAAPERLQGIAAEEIFLHDDADEQHRDKPQERRSDQIGAVQGNSMNVHSASDEHSYSDKSDCRETRDCSIPKKSAECLVNRQTVTVDPSAFESRNHAGHDQNHSQIETVANNNRRRAQRASIDMEL